MSRIGAAAIALLATMRETTGDALTAFELIPRFGIDSALRHVQGVADPLAERYEWYVLLEASAGTRSCRCRCTSAAAVVHADAAHRAPALGAAAAHHALRPLHSKHKAITHVSEDDKVLRAFVHNVLCAVYRVWECWCGCASSRMHTSSGWSDASSWQTSHGNTRPQHGNRNHLQPKNHSSSRTGQ